MLPLVRAHDTDVLKSGDRMGRLCWSPEQAPAASWSSVIQMQPVWNVLEGFGCSGDTPHVPSPEFYHQEMFRISLLLLFQEFSVDCRTGRDPMKLSSPFSQQVQGHVHLSNALQTSKAEVPWSLLFTNFVLSCRKGFLHSNLHFPFSNCKSITSLFCTRIADRIRTFQSAVDCYAFDHYWAFPFFPYPSWSFPETE